MRELYLKGEPLRHKASEGYVNNNGLLEQGRKCFYVRRLNQKYILVKWDYPIQGSPPMAKVLLDELTPINPFPKRPW